MEKTIIFKLTRPAKKAGGDRYEEGGGFTIYIPQDISHKDGMPYPEMEVTFKTT